MYRERRTGGGILLALPEIDDHTTRRDAIAMFSRVRIAIRFFFVGLAVGVLLAPRSGEETRRLVREKADRLLNDILDAATLGTYESGAGSIEPDEEAAPAARRPRSSRARSGNGARSRSTSSTSGTSTADDSTDTEANAPSTAGA